MATASSAPVYTVPHREIVAVEHPMAIKNIDNGLKTFGRGEPLAQVSHKSLWTQSLDLWTAWHPTSFLSILVIV